MIKKSLDSLVGLSTAWPYYRRMIKNAMTTANDYQDYLQAYKALHPIRQNVLRAVAAEMLKGEGAPEIGSSDISCKVYEIFRQHGEFTADLITDLRDEWLGWSSLASERSGN